MEAGTAPSIVTSKWRISYRRSEWSLHQFEVWSGELVCRVAAVYMRGSLLLWLGDGREAELGEVALGVPATTGRAGLATTLLGPDGAATAMARRLAASLARPVYVCCGTAFDRFTVPLVERGLIAEIKSRPDLL